MTRIHSASAQIPGVVVAAYASGDLVGQGVPLSHVLGQFQDGYVVHATLVDKSNVGADMRLHLFQKAVTLPADNAPLVINPTQLFTVGQGFYHTIDFPASSFQSISTTTKVCHVPKLLLPVMGSLFACLEARGAFTPLTVNDLVAAVILQE